MSTTMRCTQCGSTTNPFTGGRTYCNVCRNARNPALAKAELKDLELKRKAYAKWYLGHSTWVHSDVQRAKDVRAMAAQRSSAAQHPDQWSLDRRLTRREVISTMATKLEVEES